MPAIAQRVPKGARSSEIVVRVPSSLTDFYQTTFWTNSEDDLIGDLELVRRSKVIRAQLARMTTSGQTIIAAYYEYLTAPIDQVLAWRCIATSCATHRPYSLCGLAKLTPTLRDFAATLSHWGPTVIEQSQAMTVAYELLSRQLNKQRFDLHAQVIREAKQMLQSALEEYAELGTERGRR